VDLIFFISMALAGQFFYGEDFGDKMAPDVHQTNK
jgi:hypothetical protein